MSVNKIGLSKYLDSNYSSETNELNLKDVNSVFTTEKLEYKRTTFDETFKEKDFSQSEQGKKFIQGLIDNKGLICNKLGISDDEYDALCCMALALASQETGFGEEEGNFIDGISSNPGYVDENENLLWSSLRDKKKEEANDAASSGLTQIKIDNFVGKSEDKSQWSKEQKLFEELGIISTGVASSDNNLYDNPDLAACATVIILNSINNNYENYVAKLELEHEQIEEKYDGELTKEELYEKGKNLVENFEAISNKIDEVSDLSVQDREDLRSAIKDWIMSINDSSEEAYYLEALNDMLKRYDNCCYSGALAEAGLQLSFTQEDLDYIRYYLTSSGMEMNRVEYLAYGWNKGTGSSSMKLDRMITDKFSVILSDPEEYNYDQFTPNVEKLAELYEEQMRNL